MAEGFDAEILLETDAAEGDAAVETARAALAALGETLPGAGALCVLIADDERLRALNAQHRGMDRPTNVLAFPAAGPIEVGLGDIALSLETAAREAAEQRKSLRAHVAHLVIHGALHLLGHDHHTPDEAARMEDAERAALARLGHGDPYILNDTSEPDERGR